MGLLDEPNTLLETFSLGELAWEIAVIQKTKALKHKGRRPTFEALRRWIRRNAVDKIDRLVYDAAVRAKRNGSDTRSLDFVEAVKGELVEYARLVLRSRGRPRIRPHSKWKEMTAHRARGRSNKMAADDERRWAMFVLGVKHRLFATHGGFRDYRSVWNHLYQHNRSSDLREIADIRAVRDARKRYKWALPPGSDRAQLARFRRVVKRLKLTPPRPRPR